MEPGLFGYGNFTAYKINGVHDDIAECWEMIFGENLQQRTPFIDSRWTWFFLSDQTISNTFAQVLSMALVQATYDAPSGKDLLPHIDTSRFEIPKSPIKFIHPDEIEELEALHYKTVATPKELWLFYHVFTEDPSPNPNPTPNHIPNP